MKKILLLILVLVLSLTGCAKAAVPFYDQTNSDVIFEPEYSYSFSDDTYVLFNWTNNTGNEIYFLDQYDIEKQTKDGKWVTIGSHKDLEEGLDYSHVVSPGSTSMARYDFEVFGITLSEDTVYRISTFCYDENENFYQVYGEFVCNDEKAEAEIEDIINKSLETAEEAYNNVNGTEDTEDTESEPETASDVLSATDTQ